MNNFWYFVDISPKDSRTLMSWWNLRRGFALSNNWILTFKFSVFYSNFFLSLSPLQVVDPCWWISAHVLQTFQEKNQEAQRVGGV
jgi:hypothetical protein